MLTLRPSQARGQVRIDWLESSHSFSFGEYYDPAHRGFGHLRVINEDIVAPGGGFPTHGHRDMEIITYVLEGELAHKDSLGSGASIVPGEVQRMSAGNGILHSEFNASREVPVHLLQIWILPGEEGVTPSYAQKDFSDLRAPGKMTLLVSQDGREGSLTLHQDAELHVLDLDAGRAFAYAPPQGRKIWLQVAKGALTVNGTALAQGDGAAVENETALAFVAEKPSELLVFVV